MNAREPKQWSLTKPGKPYNTLFCSITMHFASFLADGVTWLKKSPGNPLHGFQDDIESVPQASCQTAQQKCTSRINVRANHKLLPPNFSQHHCQELNLHEFHLASDSSSLQVKWQVAATSWTSKTSNLPQQKHLTPVCFFFLDAVKVDPDNILPKYICNQFHQVLFAHNDVFNPTVMGYNVVSGPVEATVNMGPVQPPQWKGRVPQYSRDKLQCS